MVILIIFSSLYLFITSDNYILNIYYLFINFLLYFFYINKKNFFRLFFSYYNALTLAMPILFKEISIDLLLEIPALTNRSFIPETLIYISLYLSILVTIIIIFSFYFSKKYSAVANFRIVFGGKNFNPILVIILILILSITSFFWLFSLDFFNYKVPPTSLPKLTNLVLQLVTLLTTLVLCLGYLVNNNHNNYKNFLIFFYIFATLILILIGYYSGSRLFFLIGFMCIFYNHQDFFKKKIWLFLVTIPIFTSIFYTMSVIRYFDFATGFELFYNIFNKSYEEPFYIIYLIADLITDRFNYLRAINEVFLTYYDNFAFKSDYFQNIYGLIPRFLWPSKPVLGLNLNFLGIEMNVLDSKDGITAYSLHFIGESFYQLWWLGLIISFLQAIILAKIDSIKQNSSVVSHALLFNLTLFVVMTGTLLTFVPQLIALIIFTLITSAMLNKKAR